MRSIIAERVKGVPLTKAQRKIAEYFIQNEGRVGKLSSADVAREIGVSDASIIRFARAIGFEGYADLKEHIYAKVMESTYGNLSLSERLSSNVAKYGGVSTPSRFQEIIQQNITSAFLNNPPEEFEKIVSLLLNAPRRYVMGLRGCQGVAAKTGRLLSFMVPGVHILTNGECISVNCLYDMGERDVVLMFVMSRFYHADLNCARLVKERGAKLCLVTNEITGPLTPYAHATILVPSANASFYHSTVAMEMVAEYLLNRISEQVDYRSRMEQSDLFTEYQRL